MNSNAHIYGIDLASTSELIAYNRSSPEIAKKIGADAVIYQTLDDLESACASLSPRDPATQKFEVGVFCGKYVTPVDDDYFDRLERIRGESRKLKVMESARQAVMHGAATESQVRMAAKGVEVDKHGNVIPAEEDSPVNGYAAISGAGTDRPDDLERRATGESQTRVRETQDMSLHNINDHQ